MTETPEKPKLSHGGARPNAGAKKVKPQTTALRVDNRLISLLNTIKSSYATGIIDDAYINGLIADLNNLNGVQNSTVPKNALVSVPAPLEYVDIDVTKLPASAFSKRCTQTANKGTQCKKASYKLGYCRVHYEQFMKSRR